MLPRSACIFLPVVLAVATANATAADAADATAASGNDEQPEYSPQALMLRLRRLEAENAALLAEVEGLSRALPVCQTFVQTGGCDPDGPEELRRKCDEAIDAGASGYCECRAGGRANAVGCGHAQFTCAEACGTLQQTSTVQAAVGASGALSTVSTVATDGPPQCRSLRGCRECASLEGCAWCLQTRRCVPDEAWICQGDLDHVSHVRGAPVLDAEQRAARSSDQHSRTRAQPQSAAFVASISRHS